MWFSIDFEWENPGSMNTSYGYNPNDHNWVEPQEIVSRLADIVSKGGNYLLNVGPTPKGTFEQTAIDRLLKAGEWMDVNEEAIRNTSPWKVYNEGENIYFTAKDDVVPVPSRDVVVAAVIRLRAPDTVDIRGVLNVSSAKLLGSEEKIAWEQSANGLKLSIPEQAPNQLGVVYKIKMR